MTNQNIILSKISFINIIILIIIYFCKKRIKTLETKRYSLILIDTLLIPIIEIITFIAMKSGYDTSSLLYIVLNKIILIIYTTWTLLFLQYIVITILELDEEKIKKRKIDPLFFAVNIFIALAIIFTKLDFQIIGNLMIPSGLSTSIVYAVAALGNLTMVVLLLFNMKKAVNKKFVPLYIMLFFGVVSLVFQSAHPEYFLMTSLLVYTTFIMYFTIENPDVKMVEQTELAKEAAEKANRAKTDFLSSMSHEIRTPLNAIVGFSQCIEDATTIEEAKENAHDIVNASQTLLEIVNGILDISKIEAGKIEIVNSQYNAKETFEDLATLITPKMNEKGLDFTYKIAPDIPQTLYGDHANIKKIITNLLSNAAKYTEHGFVHYEVNCVNSGKYSKLIITVEDSGRGIKKDSIDKLFTKFQRLDEDKNTTIEGTGLGLAITKQLIELMGGKIIVHTIYGEGSKFTVVINQRIEEVAEVKKHHKLDTLDLNNVKLLLVDDNALNIKVATKLLEKHNANMITSVSSGFECLDKIKSGEKYDVILLDDMMPKMSGVETLQELKKLDGFNTPVIALTANAITGMREKYISEGFNDYLAKPIEKDQLIKVMNEILGRTITNQIPVEDIKEEIPEMKTEEEKQEDEDKNRILQVSEDDVDLLKNQQLISETSNINILNHDLDKVSIVKENTEDSGEVLDIEEDSKIENVIEMPKIDKVIEPPKADKVIVPEDEQIENVIEVPTDLLNTNPTPIDLPVVEEPPKIDPEEYLRSKGVDVDKALENLGDMEMYNATVDDFLSEVEDKWQRIEDYKLQNNMKDYSVEVHSLKSDAKYLGLMRLADIAYQHELASKEENEDYVNNNFNYLENEYQKALDIIKNYKETILK